MSDSFEFDYNGVKYIREGCDFYIETRAGRWESRIHISPHRYFEAYTAMKNKEAKQWQKSQIIAN